MIFTSTVCISRILNDQLTEEITNKKYEQKIVSEAAGFKSPFTPESVSQLITKANTVRTDTKKVFFDSMG
ncbi:hypothetical protein VNKP15269_C53080 (plasmid) [Klebsiella pneumoniae]|uniref:hypothetical protein n=1 Tax=Klebsiella pneumoniae TaxID=573 RepID=UPI0015EA3212|nr:hypothetical protein VNKP15269_C53080 [Klebsiella pneumoniae]